MKMSDVKIGMRLRSTVSQSPAFTPITVTEITNKGFKYSIDAPMPFTARDGSWFEKDGHEHFGLDGESFYEPIA